MEDTSEVYEHPMPQEEIDQFMPYIPKWHAELQQLLPVDAKPPKIHWFNGGPIMSKEEGVGGFSWTAGEISLAVKPGVEDKELQLTNLRAIYFHENYHQVQGFTETDASGKSQRWPAIANAVIEGAATVFERDRGRATNPSWSEYESLDCVALLKEIKALPLDYDWYVWKAYHPGKQEANLLYRVGAWVIDTLLKKNTGLKIEDLATKNWEELLALSEL